MANILTPDELTKLSDLAFELGMDVLFETHSVEELADLPKAAALIGINCRNFNSSPTGFTLSKLMRQWLWANTDKSVDTNRFDFVERIPAHAIKIAESGVTADNCAKVFALGFRAALVGTSLLMDRRGVRAALNDFAEAMLPAIVRRPGLAKLSEAPA
jgi:indole-3-glycerol phosphate synthase